MITIDELERRRLRLGDDDPTNMMAVIGVALCERLDEHNRLQEAHSALLRDVGDAAVDREAEAIQRDTDPLRLMTTDRGTVLDEVECAFGHHEIQNRKDALEILDRVREQP